MKKQMNIETISKKLVTIIFIALFAIGCAEQKLNTSDEAQTEEVTTEIPYVPPGQVISDSPSTYWDDGATVELNLEGSSAMGKIEKLMDFAGTNLNDPTGLQLNVVLEKRGDGWGGRIMTGFYNNGDFHEYTMVNGDTSTYSNTSLVEAAKYNVWFESNGDAVWHGFFQDNYGGIVLVFDQMESPGDGQPPTSVSGSVWFKNLGNYEGSNFPPTHCWFISIGPNDCRAWKSGNSVSTTTAVNPDNGYTKLATFSNLDIVEAFGEDVVVQ
jgi:hypothetical protein